MNATIRRNPRRPRPVRARSARALLFTLPALLLAAPALAVDVPPGETHPALGAPDDPVVAIAWNRFYDTAGIERILREIAAAHPGLTELVEVGESVEGRKILALEVTNESAGDPGTKPAMYIDGNVHGNEVQTAETVLYTAWYLTEMYGEVERVTKLLDERAFYLVPTINPDGRDHWFHDPNTPHSNRGGRIPVDNDGDGRFDEDGPEDLDGDGHITYMRIRDPWGRWKPDPDFPEYLMERVERDERGTYERLGREGIDNDGDGLVNEDGPGGYDPNRNWAWRWQPEGIQYGARAYPFSLPETRAVSRYVLSRPNLAAAQCYHNAGGMILRGPGQEGHDMNAEDAALSDYIAERGEFIIPGYDALVVWKDLYPVWGGEFEWFYGALGMISFTNELWTWDVAFHRDVSRGEEGNRARARFLRHLLQDQGLTPWKEYEHPDYGTVEIGGTARNFGRVPPSFLLQEELHRNMAFTLYHAESMPLLGMEILETETLDGGLHRVRVGIENHGIIPTRTGHDVENGITARNAVTLSGNGLRVIAGGVVEDPRTGRVSWQEVRPERVLLERVEGLRRTEVEFLVEGSGTATVRAEARRGGTVDARAELR